MRHKDDERISIKPELHILLEVLRRYRDLDEDMAPLWKVTKQYEYEWILQGYIDYALWLKYLKVEELDYGLTLEGHNLLNLHDPRPRIQYTQQETQNDNKN